MRGRHNPANEEPFHLELPVPSNDCSFITAPPNLPLSQEKNNPPRSQDLPMASPQFARPEGQFSALPDSTHFCW